MTRNLTEKVKAYYSEHPLRSILLAGFFFRLLAAVFSRGYGWSDDQFLVVEVAQSWVDGIDYYSWLPDAAGNNQPQGFSFFYVGLHYLFFEILKFIGINDPQTKMVFVRLVHAVWSMLTVFFGYKITARLSDRKSARTVGWMLAVFWFFPFLSVHNLVEFANIPFLMWGLWLLIKNEKRNTISLAFWAGFLFGLAFDTRFQTALISGSFGLVLLFQKRWKEVFWIALGAFLSMILVQGLVDYFVWGKPFIQIIGYVSYNATHAGDYTVGPWWVYLLFLLGTLIPPVSFFLFAGLFKEWKRLAILFFPVVIFILFHSYYPNKQERFIVTIIPFFMIIGTIGWYHISGSFRDKRWHKASWIFFWTLNTVLLLPITFTYSKKARVESMCYLSKYNKDFDSFIIEDISKSVLGHPPQFYLGKYMNYHPILNNSGTYKQLYKDVKAGKIKEPGFILFYHDNDISARVDSMKVVYPNIVFETRITPGFIDKIFYRLNPINDNQNIYIYRNKNVIPDKLNDE